MKLTKTHVLMAVAQFRKTLPEAIQHEYFRWVATTYDIAAAHYIIGVKLIKSQETSVANWAKAFGLDGERQDGAVNMLSGVEDAKAMAESIDPNIPIIIAEHVSGRGKNKVKCPLIIDGNHRLRKAFLIGREKISAYYLPEELAKFCVV